MCCNLRMHVRFTSIIYLIATGLVYWILTTKIAPLEWIVRVHLSGHIYPTYLLWHIICLYSLTSGIMCLFGAIYNNKCLLIPFIIGVCLIILVCVIYLMITILCVGVDLVCRLALRQQMSFLAFCAIFLGPSIYILIIVAKLYKERAPVIVPRQGDWVDVPERVVLRSCVPPTVTPGSTVYVAHNTL